MFDDDEGGMSSEEENEEFACFPRKSADTLCYLSLHEFIPKFGKIFVHIPFTFFWIGSVV